MSLFACVSVKGAPGVTTLACVLGAVWPYDRDVVVAECDPAGGDIAARFRLSTDVGMTSLVFSLRQLDGAGPAALSQHLQQLPGGLDVLCGPIGTEAAVVLDRAVAEVPLEALESRDLLVDCGRLGPHFPGQERILATADRVLVLLRPDAASIAYGRGAVDRLCALHPAGARGVGLLCMGTGAFRHVDVAETLGIELDGVVPVDPRAAAMLRGEAGAQRALSRSALVGAATRLASALIEDTLVELHHGR